MSYGRDPDRFTRAPGAIAARDNAHPGAAAQRRRTQNAATVAHDRKMRTMTYGPRGGLSPMGAVNLGYQGKVTTARPSKGITFESGTSNKPPVLGTGGGGGGTSPVTSWTKLGLAQLRNTGGQPMTIELQPRTTTMDPGMVIDPKPGTPAPSSAGSKPTIPRAPVPVSTGSGGGSGATPRPAPLPLPTDTVDIPDVPASSGAIALTPKTIAIAGAAALAAYFLLRKKKASSP